MIACDTWPLYGPSTYSIVNKVITNLWEKYTVGETSECKELRQMTKIIFGKNLFDVFNFFFSLALIPSANMKIVGVITYTANHQRAIQIFLALLLGSCHNVPLRIKTMT